MWLLVSLSQPNLKFTIVGDHKYIVGRQGCDIIIPDASVSRKQAVLTMAHYESNVAKSFITPTLTLEDISKFGTFVNGKPVKNPGGSTITLKHNDEIKFGGSPASVFRAVYEPFIATTSCLEKAPKKCLHKVMCLLGGHIVREWRPSCDLLIMSNINVTIKVICAINNQKHIVTPQYLDDMYAFYRDTRERPDAAKYLPEVVDQEVPHGVSFHPNVKRATLLEGLKFYFLSAVQFNKTNLAVSTAGGQPILLEDGTDEDADTMTHDGTVVVAVTRDVLGTLSSTCQKFVKLVYSTLKRNNLRMVTDPEIGWAILTCNTEDFCNPKSPITPNMLSTMASQSLSQMTDLDSSHDVIVTQVQQGKRIQASLNDSVSMATEVLESPAKKLKAEEASEGTGRHSLITNSATSKDIPSKEKPANVGSGSPVPVCQQDRFGGLNDYTESPQPPKRDSLSVSKCNLLLQESQNKGPNSDIASRKETVKKCSNPPVKSVLADPEKQTNSLVGWVKVSDKTERRREPSPEDETPSIFARQAKKNVKPTLPKLDDSDEDELMETTTRGRKRKSLFFMSEEDVVSKRGNLSESNDDGTHGESKGDGKLQQKKNSAEPDAHELVDVLDKAFSDEEMKPIQMSEKLDCTEPTAGWITVHKTCADNRQDTDGGQDTDGRQETDVKSDPELLRDEEGKLLRNLCDIQVVELLSGPGGSKLKPAAQKPDSGAQRNFKKFRKTEHSGTGKLPNIIGGRDLQVYIGSRHMDLDGIFTNGLVAEKERQEDEIRGRELFDWDDKTRKAVGKRIR